MSVEKCQSPLWTETPLIFSSHLSTRLGRDEYAVYLKLEVCEALATRILHTGAATVAPEPPAVTLLQVPRCLAFYTARARDTRANAARRMCVGGQCRTCSCVRRAGTRRALHDLPPKRRRRAHARLPAQRRRGGRRRRPILFRGAPRGRGSRADTAKRVRGSWRLPVSLFESSIPDFFPPACSCPRTTIRRYGRATRR